MYLFRFLTILQALSMILSHGNYSQGALKLGKHFHSGMSNVINDDKPKPRGNNEQTKGELPKNVSLSSTTRVTNWDKRNLNLIKYIHHVKKKGVRILKDTGTQVINEINLKENLTSFINNVTGDYVSTMQNFSRYLAGQKSKYVIDEEFSFLDMIETACKIIHNHQKKILNRLVVSITAVQVNNDSTIEYYINESFVPHIQKINQHIFKENARVKRQELRYVCFKFDLCRSCKYPAFTDYIADFIVEVQKLPDYKLQTLLNTMELLLHVNEEFFETICKKVDRDKITEIVKPYFNDVYSIHDTLAILKAILTQRFKLIHSPEVRLKLKTNGVRLILDIVNKAFDYERDGLLYIEFDTNVKALRSWNDDERLFPESLITGLFNNIIRIMDYNLSKNAKKEITVLIETIVRGSSTEEEMVQSLFRDGSKYVRGEDFHHDLEII